MRRPRTSRTPSTVVSGWRASVVTIVVAFATAVGHAVPTPVGSEFQVNEVSGYERRPAVAADPAGNFLVVWDGGQARLYDSAGVPQGGEFDVTTPGQADNPQVAADPAGNFVVVWEGFARRFDATGMALGSAFQASLGGYPDVSTDGAGNFVVVGGGVSAQRFDSTGTAQGGELQVNSGGNYPAVAADGSGNFVVVWSAYVPGPSSSDVFARRYDASGTALGNAFQVNTYTPLNQKHPDVAMAPGGSFVVVWDSFIVGAGDEIFAQRFDAAGVPLGGEFQVNTYTYQHQAYPRVAMDAGSGFVVTWQSFEVDGANDGIAARRFASDGTPDGDEFVVNTVTLNYQYHPAVAAAANGDFVVAWWSYEGDYKNIKAQRFTAAHDHGIVGKRLIIVDKTTPGPPPVTKQKIAFLARNQPVLHHDAGAQTACGTFGSAGCTTATAATLEVVDVATPANRAVFDVKAGARPKGGREGWRTDKASAAAFVNKDASPAGGGTTGIRALASKPGSPDPITSATPGLVLKAVARSLGDSSQLTLPISGTGEVDVILSVGTHTFCARFDTTAKTLAQTVLGPDSAPVGHKYIAKEPITLGTCPP